MACAVADMDEALPLRRTYSAVFGDSGPSRTLANSPSALDTGDLRPVTMQSLPPAFRRMVRDLAFDVCEMAISTYVCALAHEAPITALPIFPVRGFHHQAILVHRDSGIRSPRDLEGHKVGLERGYTVTTGVWARGILSKHYNVRLDAIDWLVGGDEHVEGFTLPAGARLIEPGGNIAQMLLNGEIAAAIGIAAEHPEIVPLIASPAEVALAAFHRDGHYPINHLVALRSDRLADNPCLASDLLDACVAAKADYLAELAAGTIERPNAADRRNAMFVGLGIDPLPYGLGPNRTMLNELISHTVEQRIIARPIAVEDMFAAATRAWAE